ncbi:XRE family transcriptional regulator [Gordonia sp. PDNC005]|uniref:XRE family transcriptional regulator n=1 Tax=Gordonia sp. PDNC005 TaxID=2811424 RepID=UPI00196600B8|nr:XRE family transcriptional regulator [Gordonia sp. PDNC005]QRY62699.1 XRE family transcriptional regulator [Gordonia sp. PDNC005]
MQNLRLRPGVIDAMKADRNFDSDAQAAAALGVTVVELERLRHGAIISPHMALQVAAVQGTGFDLSRWVEQVPA